jgi:hypothetical protein
MGKSRFMPQACFGGFVILLISVGSSSCLAQAAAGQGWKRQGEAFANLDEVELMKRMGFGSRMQNLYLGRPDEQDRFAWAEALERSRRRDQAPASDQDEPSSAYLDQGSPSAFSDTSGDDEASLVPLSPDQFLLQSEALLEAIDQGSLEGGEDGELSTGSSFLPTLSEEEPVAPFEEVDQEALEGYLLENGLDGGSVLKQTITGGFEDNTYRSAIATRTTTRSKSLRHLLEWQKGFGARNDLTLVNELSVDTLRRGEILDVTFSRQIEETGAAEVQGTLTIHQQETGEAEPDYHTKEVALSGRSDPMKGLGWDVRLYSRDQNYQLTDSFYLDNHSTSLQAGLRLSEDGFDLEGRHTLERDRYPEGPLNDVDRILSEFTAYGKLSGFDLSYSTQYQREGVLLIGELDAYRLWLNETTLARSLGSKVVMEYRLIKQSRTADLPSEFLYDSRELGQRIRAVVTLSEFMDASLSRSTNVVRNRQGSQVVDVTEDDRELTDVELYLHYGGSRLDASLTGYSGKTRYLNGQSESFADIDRSGLSMILGYVFSKAWRTDLTYSLDVEDYPTFDINNNQAESLSLSGSVSF